MRDTPPPIPPKMGGAHIAGSGINNNNNTKGNDTESLLIGRIY